MTNREKQELRQFCNRGLRFSEIRQRVNCSDATIRRYLRVADQSNNLGLKLDMILAEYSTRGNFLESMNRDKAKQAILKLIKDAERKARLDELSRVGGLMLLNHEHRQEQLEGSVKTHE